MNEMGDMSISTYHLDSLVARVQLEPVGGMSYDL